MSNIAYNFMQEVDRPHVNQEVRDKILSLFQEIDTLYKTHMRRSVNKKCDICGKGDNNETFRLKDLVPGYEHREKKSPRLCYNHFCGWNLSFMDFDLTQRVKIYHQTKHQYANDIEAQKHIFNRQKQVFSDEEIDLHFALYVAKQLKKVKNIIEGDKND